MDEHVENRWKILRPVISALLIVETVCSDRFVYELGLVLLWALRYVEITGTIQGLELERMKPRQVVSVVHCSAVVVLIAPEVLVI